MIPSQVVRENQDDVRFGLDLCRVGHRSETEEHNSDRANHEEPRMIEQCYMHDFSYTQLIQLLPDQRHGGFQEFFAVLGGGVAGVFAAYALRPLVAVGRKP